MRLWLISLKVDIHSFFYCRRTLYNSNSARKPADEQWVEKAFELQKLYWGENSVVDLKDTHKKAEDNTWMHQRQV